MDAGRGSEDRIDGTRRALLRDGAMVAAVFGFGGIAAAAADIARILFFIAIVIFLVLLVAGLMAGSTLF